MKDTLNDIADLLRQRGLTIDVGISPYDAVQQIWYVSDLPEQTMIRVMIVPDPNGQPSF